MKPYVLMCKRTGNILEGFRVNLMGADESQYILQDKWSVALVEIHGWIVRSDLPESGFGGFYIFMNAEWVDENFQVLGEL